MYKLVVFIPSSHLDVVKKALFEAGAGKMKNYDSCCFQIKGKGQFRPLKGSSPFVGKENMIEEVEEIRLETVVGKNKIKEVISSMKKAHPYEVPAYDVILLEEF